MSNAVFVLMIIKKIFIKKKKITKSIKKFQIRNYVSC